MLWGFASIYVMKNTFSPSFSAIILNGAIFIILYNGYSHYSVLDYCNTVMVFVVSARLDWLRRRRFMSKVISFLWFSHCVTQGWSSWFFYAKSGTKRFFFLSSISICTRAFCKCQAQKFNAIKWQETFMWVTRWWRFDWYVTVANGCFSRWRKRWPDRRRGNRQMKLSFL